MEPIAIRQLYQQAALPEGEVSVRGWVRSLRSGKDIAFLMLYDGSCFETLQVVLNADTLPNFAEATHWRVGCAVSVQGVLQATPKAKQPFELQASAISLEGDCPSDYPLQKKRHSLEFLRTMAHLRGRTNTLGAVFRIRSAAALAIHRFFEEQGFVYMHTPIITTSDCEGAGEQFSVTTLDLSAPPMAEGEVDYTKDFFGKQASLTVSGQLEGECMALALGKIYTFGPTFRAERSNTPRHAAEFWMIEPEMSFADLEENKRVAQAMLQYVLRDILTRCPSELAFLEQFVKPGLLHRLQSMTQGDFASMTYTEAIEKLVQSGRDFVYPVSWGCDLQTEHERYLTEEVVGGPVFVTDYPKQIKAFYMRLNDDQTTVAAMDLLVPDIGELIGGSQREEREEILRQRMQECGLQEEAYDWYLELRRFGGVVHSGFGIGFERLVMLLTGMTNIRDVLPFPRTTGSADF